MKEIKLVVMFWNTDILKWFCSQDLDSSYYTNYVKLLLKKKSSTVRWAEMKEWFILWDSVRVVTHKKHDRGRDHISMKTTKFIMKARSVAVLLLTLMFSVPVPLTVPLQWASSLLCCSVIIFWLLSFRM